MSSKGFTGLALLATGFCLLGSTGTAEACSTGDSIGVTIGKVDHQDRNAAYSTCTISLGNGRGARVGIQKNIYLPGMRIIDERSLSPAEAPEVLDGSLKVLEQDVLEALPMGEHSLVTLSQLPARDDGTYWDRNFYLPPVPGQPSSVQAPLAVFAGSGSHSTERFGVALLTTSDDLKTVSALKSRRAHELISWALKLCGRNYFEKR